jgi:two-component system, OmpR family, response regulator VanR
MKDTTSRLKTVLVVDDAPGIRHMIKLYLEPEGYAVLQAADAETALTLCKRQRVDLVILDMMLPGNVMGNDIFMKLKKQRATANIPVICMSGLSAYADALHTMDARVVFLQKPFNKEQLMPLIVGVNKEFAESV